MARLLWLMGLALLLPGDRGAAPEGYRRPLPAAPRHIYLVSHGWHAGLVLQRAEVPPGLWPKPPDFPQTDYLEIGWGDAGFYPHPDPPVGVLLKAALWPTPSVLHLVGFDRPPDAYFVRQEVVRIALSEEDLETLVRFIRAAFAREEGRAIPLGPGLYGESRFYAARGRYTLFHNCNHWTAEAMRVAGCPIVPATALTVENLFYQVHQFAEEAWKSGEVEEGTSR